MAYKGSTSMKIIDRIIQRLRRPTEPAQASPKRALPETPPGLHEIVGTIAWGPAGHSSLPPTSCALEVTLSYLNTDKEHHRTNIPVTAHEEAAQIINSSYKLGDQIAFHGKIVNGRVEVIRIYPRA
jgi:hypothetical protein